jgi:hypothetical protein
VHRNWTRWRPSNLQEAVEGCVRYAQDKHRLSVDRLADLVGESKWTIYKWIESGSIPARKIAGFEAHCRCCFITAYLAASARRMLIELPTGRLPETHDIQELQRICHDAIGSLISFAAGQCGKQETVNALTVAIEHLASERAHVDLNEQPELSLS